MSYYNQQPQAPVQGLQNNDMEALSWDSEITAEVLSFTLLPEGEYPFVVVNFEAKNYQPGPMSKIPPCPMAEITVRVKDPESGNDVDLKENLYLYKKMEWKIAQFFACIGQKKEGEAFRPDWKRVLGSKGVADVEINEYENKNGEKRRNNRVNTWLPQKAPTTPQPQVQQWQTGSF